MLLQEAQTDYLRYLKTKKVIIFGAGENGKIGFNGLKWGEIEVTAFCDNDEKKHGQTICGISIISFKKLCEMNNEDVIIVICSNYEREIKQQLMDANIHNFISISQIDFGGGEEYPLNPWELKKVDELDLLVITVEYWESVYLRCIELQMDLEKIRYWDSRRKNLYSIDEMYMTGMYSLGGEDIYLARKFVNKKKGFYVDVGSFHPFRYSNTYWAYKKGWSGINIEPNTENFRLFEKMRPRDININCGISDVEGDRQYYQFEESALNTFDCDMVRHYVNTGHRLVKDPVQVKTRRLDNILKENKIERIDFLDIDVEGTEMDILKSIDFNVDIECILLEQGNAVSFSDVINSQEGKFLEGKGYHPVNRCGITTIFEKV